MRTKLLYACCPECGYQNAYHTDRKDRKRIRAESWPGLVSQCGRCGTGKEEGISH